MSFDYWLSLSKKTAKILEKDEPHLVWSSKTFSEQLFSSYTAPFVTDLIVKYAEQVSTNEKFKQAVSLLFN